MVHKINMAKRYIAIVKIRNNPNGGAHCVKYRFNDLVNFTNFLDKAWPDWKWYNVYSNLEKNKGTQLANFTKNKRPINKSL
jgi:hypothetical protein